MIWESDCFNYNSEQSTYSALATDEHLVQNVCQWDIADDEEKEEEDFIVILFLLKYWMLCTKVRDRTT